MSNTPSSSATTTSARSANTNSRELADGGNRTAAGPLMSKAIAIFLGFERRLNAIVTALSMLLLAVAAAVAFYQVVTRFVLQQPATWSEVLIRTLLVWMVYLGVTAGFRSGALVAVDALARAVSGQGKRWLEGAIASASLALLVVIVWWGWQVAWRSRFQNLAGLEIPIIWLYAAAPVGAGFAILAVIARFLDPPAQPEIVIE